jgi:hypothetical protein
VGLDAVALCHRLCFQPNACAAKEKTYGRVRAAYCFDQQKSAPSNVEALIASPAYTAGRRGRLRLEQRGDRLPERIKGVRDDRTTENPSEPFEYETQGDWMVLEAPLKAIQPRRLSPARFSSD